MADTYQRSKELWGFKKSKEGEMTEEKIEKATAAGTGRGDERAKAGDVKEAGEKRADVTDSSSIPAENKKEATPTEGEENLKNKKNPPGSPAGATKGRGDEREKAGGTKEEGEKRAVAEKNPCPSLKKGDEVEKCNDGKPMIKPEDKEKIKKSFEADEKLVSVAEASKGMKGLSLNQVLLMKGLINTKANAISEETGLDKDLVKAELYDLFKAI